MGQALARARVVWYADVGLWRRDAGQPRPPPGHVPRPETAPSTIHGPVPAPIARYRIWRQHGARSALSPCGRYLSPCWAALVWSGLWHLAGNRALCQPSTGRAARSLAHGVGLCGPGDLVSQPHCRRWM